MKILSFSEEQKLTNKEIIDYYKCLKEYLITSPHENITKGSLSICKTINPIVRQILKRNCGYELIIEGNDKIRGLTGIYAHTHQSKMDHVNLIASNHNHTIILNSEVLSTFYKMVLSINGVVYVNKFDKESKKKAKLEMMRLLLSEKSVTIFPESAWNLSPNKLHLPLYMGFIDMAKKTGKPIIPVVQEYYYDNSKLDGIERIKKVHVVYGNPIFVGQLDNPFEKLEEYSNQISTIRWDLISKNKSYKRNEISNYEYINFLKGCIRNLKNAGIDINVENAGIYGSKDDFYLFHHINSVDYDDNGNLLPTEYVRKLRGN